MIVLEENKKDELINILKEWAIKLKKKGINSGSLNNSVRAMAESKVVLHFFNADLSEFRAQEDVRKYVDIQSIGGAIQTMLLGDGFRQSMDLRCFLWRKRNKSMA